jgi:hypothetical protein
LKRPGEIQVAARPQRRIDIVAPTSKLAEEKDPRDQWPMPHPPAYAVFPEGDVTGEIAT